MRAYDGSDLLLLSAMRAPPKKRWPATYSSNLSLSDGLSVPLANPGGLFAQPGHGHGFAVDRHVAGKIGVRIVDFAGSAIGGAEDAVARLALEAHGVPVGGRHVDGHFEHRPSEQLGEAIFEIASRQATAAQSIVYAVVASLAVFDDAVAANGLRQIRFAAATTGPPDRHDQRDDDATDYVAKATRAIDMAPGFHPIRMPRAPRDSVSFYESSAPSRWGANTCLEVRPSSLSRPGNMCNHLAIDHRRFIVSLMAILALSLAQAGCSVDSRSTGFACNGDLDCRSRAFLSGRLVRCNHPGRGWRHDRLGRHHWPARVAGRSEYAHPR